MTVGHLARFRVALMVTGPDWADYAERLAAVGAAHERVPLGESAPFGCVAARGPPGSRGASRSDRAGYLRCAVADGTAPLLRHPTPAPGAGEPGDACPGRPPG